MLGSDRLKAGSNPHLFTLALPSREREKPLPGDEKQGHFLWAYIFTLEMPRL
jgi:hypothetical protein